MGMYDNIHYKCKYCGKETVSQTKLGVCMMEIYEVGDYFLDEKITMNLLMKDPCDHCKKHTSIIIENGKIVGCCKEEDATHEEVCWGQVNKIDLNEIKK